MKITPLHDWIGARIGCSTKDYTREQMEQYQLEKLQGVLTYALERSPFYKILFAVSPKTITSFTDLAAFPFTTADYIRENPNRFVCVSQDEIQRIVTLPTSGTTGISKRIFFTSEDQELTIDFFKTGMSTLANPGDKVLILLPGQRPGSVGDLLRVGLERLGCLPVVYGPIDDEEKVFQTIIEKEINVLVGAPVQLHRLARLDDQDWILPKNQIHKVLTSTDVLANTIRANLQAIWGCEVFDHWGMTETGLGGGVECEAHHGFHMREADLYIEIIDPESGKPLQDGDYGEVVITTLTRTGMPLIRYRTGDLGRLIPAVCSCGSFVKRLDRITNRIGAGIQLSLSLLTQNDMDEVLFQIPGILDFSASVEQHGAKIVLTLLIQTNHDQLNEVEYQVFETFENNPLLHTELSNGNLELDIIPLEKTIKEAPNSLQKRGIKTNTAGEG